MSEAAASVPQSQPSPYPQAWVESLAQVLGQMSGSSHPCMVLPAAPAELLPPAESDLWMVCACSGALRGEMSLRIPSTSIVRLAQIFMSEPSAPAVDVTSDHREAAEELLRQVAGLVATALKASWGEVQLRLETSAGAPSWPPSSTVWLRAGSDPGTAALLELHLSAALVAALRPEKPEAAQPAATLAPPVPASADTSQVKLGLLMDVELAVTLRFGSRRLLLRDVLDLIPGSVVDLDRQVEEPVDILLDGQLLARGEVVVLDGNYGVRVTEVAPSSL